MVYNKILELKETIINQAHRIQKMLENCRKGLLEKDVEAIEKVLNKQEKKVNKKEIKIDDEIIKILALYHPEAKDLRYVIMMSKMNYDLERMGDHCVNIAESAKFLLDKEQVKPYIDIPRMFDITKNMLENGLNSFINENSSMVLEICKMDDEVDGLNEQVFRELLTYMITNAKTIEPGMHVLRISNNIEKIADLATNIAEEVFYIVEGKTIRHNKYKKFLKVISETDSSEEGSSENNNETSQDNKNSENN